MMYSLILRTTVRLLVPLILVFSVFALLRGHSAPGGGFVGGLSAAAAVALHALAEVERRDHALLPVPPLGLAAFGLLCALVAGLLPVLVGRPFLTSLWAEVPLPGTSPLALGTPLLFDAGVYLVVLGVVSAIVFALEAHLDDPEVG